MKLPSSNRPRPIDKMPRTQPYSRGPYAAATALLLIWMPISPCALAQAPASTLPPTQPTSLQPVNPSIPGPSQTAAQPVNRPHVAQVTYVADQLQVRANNSSLNQILRSISHLTGLQITGGVQDQRVFGTYGPATTSTVLATLLDGTGTNILLLEGDATNPPRLVLTPRGGGATPPGPDSLVYAAYDSDNNSSSAPAQQTQQPSSQLIQIQTPSQNSTQSIPSPANDVNGSSSNTSPTASTLPTTHSVSLDSVPTPSMTPSTPGIVDAPNPPAPGSTIGTQPNGTLTPEIVAQKLLQMQQQSAQPPASATPPH